MSHIVTTWAEFDDQGSAEAHAKELAANAPKGSSVSVQHHEPYDPVLEEKKQAERDAAAAVEAAVEDAPLDSIATTETT